MGNFDNSRGLEGELVAWLSSEVAPGLMLAGFAAVPLVGFGAILSVRTIWLANCDGFGFHQTLPANAEATTMHTSRTSIPGRGGTLSGSPAGILVSPPGPPSGSPQSHSTF